MFKLSRKFSQSNNPYNSLKTKLKVGGVTSEYFSLSKLDDPRVENLPYSIRVLLESAIRNCDNFSVTEQDVEKILNWQENDTKDVEIPFKPARVLLQDFTGVPAVVDLAAIRDAVQSLGVDPQKINPQVPVDLVIDHSVQVDTYGNQDALNTNEAIEFKRNYERFEFLKWGQNAFDNFQIVPPGSGIVHQVNLEYLARVVMNRNGLLYPDSVVGTDSHTTMINGLGVVGWGVGGIEAEAVMLGQHISMVLPEVVGFKLTGQLSPHVTATDLVLTVVQMLRERGVVGKFVEFFGEGVATLSLADRATIGNMGPEYGATIGYFPVDGKTVDYLKLTGRDENTIDLIEGFLQEQGLFRDYHGANPEFSGSVLELDLAEVEPCLSGPKRPHDRVNLSDMQRDFKNCLANPIGFKGFGLEENEIGKTVNLNYKGEDYTLHQGSVIIAAITSCTNTSNPGVMLAAGMLAKNAVEKGLTVDPYIRTSLSPGSGVVTKYFEASGVQQYLEQLGFYTAGYGCMTCIGNSGELDPEVDTVLAENDLVASAVLSGNRNFEGRVHPYARASYLASPPLVVAYALAGSVDFDFDTTPLGQDNEGNDVFLRDIWPTQQEVNNLVEATLSPEMFTDTYDVIAKGTPRWNALEVDEAKTYGWKEESTYIHNPPFFQGLTLDLPEVQKIENAYCLLNLGDSITTDHISPAGKISEGSPAARYLTERGVKPIDFNTYGARRGNDEIMARGTFANIRLINKMIGDNIASPETIHVPTGEKRAIFDAASEYMMNGQPTIVLAGEEYGSGSSRDWAAKGPFLQGIKAVIAQSFERIHRSNLVGMGVLPLQFLPGENADTLGLDGFEQFSIEVDGDSLEVNQKIQVTTNTGKTFTVKSRLDTAIELDYYRNGGILSYVLRNLANSN